jgi:light-regulated signal transduction histidine kinase (bacteriophytochrome)
LRGIQGFSHIILEENSDVLNQDARDHLRFIMDSARRMGVMIDALLLFSRLTRVEFQKIDLNLSGMVTEITQALVKSDPQRKAQIRISPGLVCQADRKYIRIALENLLSNAWKFTSKTPESVITFGSEMVDAQSVFFVRDNGAGFDMRYSKKLFGAFQRLHRVDEFPGEGVGLAIAQRIIQRHGGRIWAEAEPSEGATFYFTLPA